MKCFCVVDWKRYIYCIDNGCKRIPQGSKSADFGDWLSNYLHRHQLLNSLIALLKLELRFVVDNLILIVSVKALHYTKGLQIVVWIVFVFDAPGMTGKTLARVNEWNEQLM